MDRKPQPERKPAIDVLKEFMEEEGIDIIFRQPQVFHSGQGEMLIKVPNPAYQVVYTDELTNGQSN
jgi:hypothetical protein